MCVCVCVFFFFRLRSPASCHASSESDVDSLLQSFDEMGLKLNRYDPFEDMKNMQRGFGETVGQLL